VRAAEARVQAIKKIRLQPLRDSVAPQRLKPLILALTDAGLKPGTTSGHSGWKPHSGGANVEA
jgi:hypothetical protein